VSARAENVIPLRATRGPLLSMRELAAELGFSERWVRYRVQEGMPKRRWGNQYRFRLTEVEAWLEERYAQT